MISDRNSHRLNFFIWVMRPTGGRYYGLHEKRFEYCPQSHFLLKNVPIFGIFYDTKIRSLLPSSEKQSSTRSTNLVLLVLIHPL